MHNKLAEKIVRSYFRDNVRGCDVEPDEIFTRGYRHPSAIIHDSAEVDPAAIIGQNVVIGPKTKIKKAIIGRFAHIGANNVIEDYTIFCENARIGNSNHIGEDNLFEDGCCIGTHNTIKNDCYFDRWAQIANNCTIGERVTTRARVIIEDGVNVPANAVLDLRERLVLEDDLEDNETTDGENDTLTKAWPVDSTPGSTESVKE